MLVYTLGEIAEEFGLVLVGDAQIPISGIAALPDAQAGDLAFLFNIRYLASAESSHASALVTTQAHSGKINLPLLITPKPRLAWAKIAGLFDVSVRLTGIDQSAVIHPQAKLGENVAVGPNAVIGAGVELASGVSIGAGSVLGERTKIGQNSTVHPNVTLYHDIVIGKDCIIHSGAVIGADGFGFEPDADTASLVKIPQIYAVQIGSDVEIGAGTTIDRGALNDTVIGDGVKIDNQVQVGHGTQIGSHTAISGATAIAGSTRIGSYCLIGGAVGIVDNIEIVDQVEITAMSLVSASIRTKGRYSSGTGLMPGKLWKRNIVVFKHLNEIAKRLRKLEG
ncbi:MAG TPA: UDP-3-O-(3-hydroxymyristoyl)glucosamine N-acyltransferase [Gammaproteobacteria bacterium]|nr:UDP-3-O-(3-hydroxymyristoyl)glucosamine N-acyltransferase [Gammaproteobacteria bacterium]HIK70764.1 UDP-3-O-(3-hydroxymyristoyl)glucosamine N-acyltransferase [Pseudomonadales bacterium]